MKTTYRAALFAATLSSILTLLFTRPATAEVKISDVEGWQFYTNGRVNAFLSYLSGDGYPADLPGQMNNFSAGAGLESVQGDNSNHLDTIRLRSGFVGAVLGFSVQTHINPETTVRAHIETWNTIETNRQKAAPNPSDVREAYGKIEGPWGGLLFGRALALFSRGAILLDYNYAHGFGLGYPCTADRGGPTCGQVGYGVVFAGYNPQITYNTPRLAGFQFAGGIFDPTNAVGSLEKTPLPRVEAELSFDRESEDGSKVHVFVNGMWQKLVEKGSPKVANAPEPRVAYARGVNYGAWAELWKLRLGVSSHFGYGIGMNNTLENTPVVFDGELKPRKFDGYYAVVGLDLGSVYLHVGAGVTRLFATQQDYKDAQANRQDPIKMQRGISAGFNYRITKYLVADVDYFNAKHSWYLGDTQNVNVLNSGLTLAW